MKSKYLRLIVAICLCFSMILPILSCAETGSPEDSTKSAEAAQTIPPEDMGRNLSEMDMLRAKANAYDMLMLERKANEEAEAKRQEEIRKANERKEELRKAKEKRERKIAELKAKVEHQCEVVNKANERANRESARLMYLEMELEALMDEEA